MKHFMYAVINKLLLIWSFSPLFAMVNNKNFMNGEYIYKENNYSIDLDNMEFCVINLRFGMNALQVICLGKKGVLGSKYVDATKINEVEKSFYIKIEKDYRNHLNEISSSDQKIEESAIEMQQKRYERSMKMIEDKLKSLHAVFIAMFFPILLCLLKQKNLDFVKYEETFLFINIYLIMNILLLLLRFYSCHSINIKTFKSLKDSIQKDKELIAHKYMNWQYEKERLNLYGIYNHVYTDIVNIIIVVDIACILYIVCTGDIGKIFEIIK